MQKVTCGLLLPAKLPSPHPQSPLGFASPPPQSRSLNPCIDLCTVLDCRGGRQQAAECSHHPGQAQALLREARSVFLHQKTEQHSPSLFFQPLLRRPVYMHCLIVVNMTCTSIAMRHLAGGLSAAIVSHHILQPSVLGDIKSNFDTVTPKIYPTCHTL